MGVHLQYVYMSVQMSVCTVCESVSLLEQTHSCSAHLYGADALLLYRTVDFYPHTHTHIHAHTRLRAVRLPHLLEGNAIHVSVGERMKHKDAFAQRNTHRTTDLWK